MRQIPTITSQFLTLVMLAVVSAIPVAAVDTHYHVAVTGSDAATGDADHPWRTVNHAATIAAPGDTVVVHAGTYALTHQIGFTNSGTAGHPISVMANPGDTVLIDGGSGYCLGLQGRSYLKFRGLGFTTASTAVGAGMVYMEGTNYCEFQACTFSGMPTPNGSENTAAIRCMQTEFGQSVGCVFRNNRFTDNRSPALRLYDTDGWLIENNEFRNCQQAVGGKDQPNNMVVRHNLIVGGDIAFYFAAQSGCTNVTITENIVIGAHIGFMVGGLGTYGNLRDDIKLYNNSFYECTNFIVGWDDAFTRRQSYFNNIFLGVTAKNIGPGSDTAGRFLNLDKYGSVAVSPANYAMDFNCLTIPANDTSLRFIDASLHAQTLADWTRIHPPFEAHSLAVDPRFVDAAGGDFHLLSGSACRGTGRNGEDLGAYPRGDDGTVIGISVASMANHAPTVDGQRITTFMDEATVITMTASDADGDALTYALVAGPSHGTLTGSGVAWTYTPAAGYLGADSFACRANDGTVDSTVATITITVLREPTDDTGTGGISGSGGGSGGLAHGADQGDLGHGCGTGGMVGLIAGIGLLLRLRLRRSF